jgi:S1-C subfamily serine protease
LKLELYISLSHTRQIAAQCCTLWLTRVQIPLVTDRIGVSFDPAAVELPGVRISYIDEEGQAARAGLLKWDKVLSLNGFPLECPLEAAQVLRDSQVCSCRISHH